MDSHKELFYYMKVDGKRLDVSILVVMDSHKELEDEKKGEADRIGFNPCCNGFT